MTKKPICAEEVHMKAIVSIENLASNFVLTFWTPVFVAIFIAIIVYALRPRNKALFDAAAKMPLQED
jgi:cytochrome c oxidase cbb3-type subunit 4